MSQPGDLPNAISISSDTTCVSTASEQRGDNRRVSTATTTDTSPSPPVCHFYRLSAELRNEIYALALFPQPREQRAALTLLATDTTLDDTHGYEVSLSNTVPYRTPGLLHTSRRLRMEASGIFYSNVIFFKHAWHRDGFTDDVAHFQKLLSSLTSEDRELIKKVRLEAHIVRAGWDAPMLELFSILCDQTGNEQVREVLQVPIQDEAGAWEYRKVKGHPYELYEYSDDDEW